ncbi:MAG: hypothetical protein IKE36_09135 [Solobacterium sp.]|nr:hypothetical protein [Solobacterium sp.]
MFNTPKEIRVCEVCTRDGFQSLPYMIDADDKVKLVNMIVDAGIKEIEVGSFLPDRGQAKNQMGNTPEVFDKLNRREGVVYRALLQTPAGAQQAVDHGCNKFKINISGSQKHYELMTGKSIEEGIKGFAGIGKIAAENNVALLGSISLAFESPYDGIVPLDRLRMIISNFLDIGVTQISMNDTAGMATPGLVNEYFKVMIAEFPTVERWCFHPHNTRGMGLANTLSAIDAGVLNVDSSLAGTGGCTVFKNASGNISTEDLVYMLDGLGVTTGIDFAKLLVAGEFTRELVPADKWDSYLLRLEQYKRQGDGSIE